MTKATCWVVCDSGKIGTENQCIGLAESLGFEPQVKRIETQGIWRYLPPQFWLKPLAGLSPKGDQLTPPWPDLIVAAGRASVAPTAFIRRITEGRTKVIQLQNPRIDPKNFDLVIAPDHDELKGENVITTKGALHRVTRERLTQDAKRFAPLVDSLPRPLVTVLIGGTNACYQLDSAQMKTLALSLKSLHERYDVGLAITVSRRTAPECQKILTDNLKDVPAVIWAGEGENPYFGFLGLADFIIVTCDSVSMASEACFTGKPVYVYELPGGSEKFNRFHQSFFKYGYTRPFREHLEPWSYEPLDEFQEVVKRVGKLINNS